jgi:hypothetical protein
MNAPARVAVNVAILISLAVFVNCNGGGCANATAPGCSVPPTSSSSSTPPAPSPPSPPPTPAGASMHLSIPGVFQETSEWCWAAVGEMVLRYNSEPNLNPAGNYQCGEIGAAGVIGLLPPVCQADCTQCVLPISGGDAFAAFLQQYPQVARFNGFPTARSLSVNLVRSALPFSQIASTVNASHPIIAGITPSNIPSPYGPSHATLIVGFDSTNGRQLLFVNDPYPYGLGPLGPFGDPYLLRGATYISRGRYAIDYNAFTSGLFWAESIVVQ